MRQFVEYLQGKCSVCHLKIEESEASRSSIASFDKVHSSCFPELQRRAAHPQDEDEKIRLREVPVIIFLVIVGAVWVAFATPGIWIIHRFFDPELKNRVRK